MLTLTRNQFQPVRLKVGDVEIWVMIGASAGDGSLQLVFDAPPEVRIERNEILPPIDRMESRSVVSHGLRDLIIANAQGVPGGKR